MSTFGNFLFILGYCLLERFEQINFQGYLCIFGIQPFAGIAYPCVFSVDLDGSVEESIDGEGVGEDADDVDKTAVADKEMDLPPGLPHVQTIDIFLQICRQHYAKFDIRLQ